MYLKGGDAVMGKKLFSKLVFAFMFFICILFTQKDTAKADVYLDMDNTTITEENAVVSVMSYSDNVPIKAIPNCSKPLMKQQAN